MSTCACMSPVPLVPERVYGVIQSRPKESIMYATAQASHGSEQHAFTAGEEARGGYTVCGILITVHSLIQPNVRFPGGDGPVCRTCDQNAR